MEQKDFQLRYSVINAGKESYVDISLFIKTHPSFTEEDVRKFFHYPTLISEIRRFREVRCTLKVEPLKKPWYARPIQGIHEDSHLSGIQVWCREEKDAYQYILPLAQDWLNTNVAQMQYIQTNGYKRLNIGTLNPSGMALSNPELEVWEPTAGLEADCSDKVPPLHKDFTIFGQETPKEEVLDETRSYSVPLSSEPLKDDSNK